MVPLQPILTDTLEAARLKDFAGYSKFDALNSSFLFALSSNNKWLRILITQAIKESPINLRPLFGVEKSRNPKGIALFARAYLFLYQITKEKYYLDQAKNLLEWLLKHPSKGTSYLCWGYNYLWQSTLFLQEKYEPNAIVTVFVGEALIHGYQVTGDGHYLKAAVSVAQFITSELPVLYETEDERAIAYVLREVKAIVLNNQVLTGSFLAKVWKHTGNDFFFNIASKQIRFTVKRRTQDYAWFYTFPAEKSHIRHDNYHTGGILDGILEFCEETEEPEFMAVYWKGLEFYKQNLFDENGAPRWMNDKRFPYDVHGAAQGIITFAKAGAINNHYFRQADKIAEWTVTHLYLPDKKEFIYRIGAFFKWNYSLMRWCNGWMTRAMSELLYYKKI